MNLPEWDRLVGIAAPGLDPTPVRQQEFQAKGSLS
jgi:hypothetical protein